MLYALTSLTPPNGASPAHKAEVRGGKLPDVRERCREVARRDAEPERERRGVLVDRDRRVPPASSGRATVRVIWPVGYEGRERAVEIAADHGPAHDEVMTAPRVIRSRARPSAHGRRQGPAEV